MMNVVRSGLAAGLLVLVAACSPTKSSTDAAEITSVQLPPDKAEVEAIVQAYLTGNPDLVAGAGLEDAARNFYKANPDAAAKAQTEAVIQSYLMENPELIINALNAYEARQAEERKAELAALVTAQKPKLYATKTDPAIGSAKAPITVVEFFDYRC